MLGKSTNSFACFGFPRLDLFGQGLIIGCINEVVDVALGVRLGGVLGRKPPLPVHDKLIAKSLLVVTDARIGGAPKLQRQLTTVAVKMWPSFWSWMWFVQFVKDPVTKTVFPPRVHVKVVSTSTTYQRVYEYLFMRSPPAFACCLWRYQDE